MLVGGCTAPGTQNNVPTIPNTPDYALAIWNPAATRNYQSATRPNGFLFKHPITTIVIHTTEGSAASAIQRFQNPTSRVSAHYLVASDGQITQFVHEKDIAWHSGNPDVNAHSIGIEHEAFSMQPDTLTDAMYRSSAALTRYLCLKYDIPMDREHIIGHNEVPDPKKPGQFGGVDGHTDPGPYWNWDYYMQMATQGVGSPLPTTETH